MNVLQIIKTYPELIEYVKEPTEEVQLVAVCKNGYLIEHINNPSEDIQFSAVNQNGKAIKFLSNPSEELKNLASINTINYENAKQFLIDLTQ